MVDATINKIVDCARMDIDSRTAIMIRNLPQNAAELNQPLENLTDIIVKDENPPEEISTKDETNNYFPLQYTWSEPVDSLNKIVKPEVGDLQANDSVIEKELRNSEEIFVKEEISETMIKHKFIENSSAVKVEHYDAPVKVEKDPDDIAFISEDEINEGIAINEQATDINRRISNKKNAINFNAIKLRLSQKLNEPKPKLHQGELYSYKNTELTSVLAHRKHTILHTKIHGEIDSSRQKHNKERHFKCSLCPFESKWKNTYRKHFTLLHNGETPFKCDKFNFETETKPRNNNNNRSKWLESSSSTSIKYFNCNDCKYKTQLKYCLRRHLQTHLKYKLFHCNKCDYKAATKGTLKAHELSHHRSFKCKDCTYIASSKQYMQQHAKEQGHTDEFAKMRRVRFLVKHETDRQIPLENTGEKLYECAECEYKTHTQYNFHKHKTLYS